MSEYAEKKESYTITSDAQAKWALTKIKEARADRDFWVNWYNQKIKEVKEQTDYNTANLEAALAAYFDTVPHRKTDTQEIYDLPGGKLVLKLQNPEFKRDDDKVIEWLKKNGGNQFIKVKEELNWSALKDATAVLDGHIVYGDEVTEDGEIVPLFVPGIDVVDRPVKFVVEVK
jgi:phage host-nuclease inhibitor protein Gam